jgi:importin-5
MGNVDALNMKLATMYLVEITCESAFNDQLLLGYSAQLIALFDKGLADPANEVQVATFKTLTIFLSTIQEEGSLKQFNPLLKNILNKAIELIKFDQESGISALESLNELIETHPKFTKPIFDDLLMVFTEIMETQQLLVNLRSTAMAGILTLCNSHHTLVRKSSHFKTRMVPSYMKMLAELHHTSMEEWAEELLDEQISKSDISMITEEHLAQIATELGNKFMLPLFIPYIQQGIGSQEMAYQHAGLTAMALLVENCHENYKKELKNMVGLMLPLLQSDNPRIIYDILIAMGYMATEFAPEIQTNFGGMILEFIGKAMQHPLLKVQYKAVLCIVNFEQGLAEHKDVKVIEPYLPSLLSHLARIF